MDCQDDGLAARAVLGKQAARFDKPNTLALLEALQELRSMSIQSARRSKASSTATVEFNWQDPLDLESALSEDERMIRDSARAFCSDKLAPRILKAFREERFDRQI